MFFFRKGKLQQIKICYLFLHADGTLSAKETAHLNEIISKKDLLDSELEEFKAFRCEMAKKIADGTIQSVVAEVEKLLNETSSVSFFSGSIDRDKTLQAETVWTLINLGYADDEYTNDEKAVVDYLVGRWKMNPALVAELNDTADTILALSLQKEWVQSTTKPQEEIDRIIQEIEKDITSMFSNVETTISEADIV